MMRNNERVAKGLDKLFGLAGLVVIPFIGVYAGVKVRREVEDPIMTAIFLGGLETVKTCFYSSLLGNASTYLF